MYSGCVAYSLCYVHVLMHLAWVVCSLLLFLLMESLRPDETQSQSHPDSLFLCDFSERSNDMEIDEEVNFREKSWTLDQLLDRIDTSLDFITVPGSDLQVTGRVNKFRIIT